VVNSSQCLYSNNLKILEIEPYCEQNSSSSNIEKREDISRFTVYLMEQYLVLSHFVNDGNKSIKIGKKR